MSASRPTQKNDLTRSTDKNLLDDQVGGKGSLSILSIFNLVFRTRRYYLCINTNNNDNNNYFFH